MATVLALAGCAVEMDPVLVQSGPPLDSLRDTTAPVITFREPMPRAVDVLAVEVIVELSERVFSADAQPVTLSDAEGVVPAELRYDEATRRLILMPLRDLAPGVEHWVTVSRRIVDAAGNPLAGTPTIWPFTTSE